MAPLTYAASPHVEEKEDFGHQGLSPCGSGSRNLRNKLEIVANKESASKTRAYGASYFGFFTAVFCFLVATTQSATAGAHVRTDAVQLVEVYRSFGAPRELQDPTDIQPVWFRAWKLVLHNQIDGILSAIAHRPPDKISGPGQEPSLHLSHESGVDFMIAMVGDSTMRMQAKALSWLFQQRDELTCKAGRSKSSVDLKCLKAESNREHGGVLSASPEITISVRYIKTIEGCQGEVEADFVYFGCGLRILQLIPDREESAAALDTWVHYERLLEEAVLYYRSGGGSGGSRVPVGEAFMTTHSFADEVLDGEYEIRVREYKEKNESLLTTCRDTVDAIELVHPDWESEYLPEDICTRGTFDEAGVLDLNRRAETVMSRLGVPTVRAYDMTQGQLWATGPQDGRHYPAMIPVELSSFLSQLATALRLEKRTSLGGGV